MEIGLFLRELNSFIEHDNEIDDETIKLLTETFLSMNKLQCAAIFRESIADDDNNFFMNLDDEHFQFRRHIVCCLCHVSFLVHFKPIFKLWILFKDHISMSRDDFEAHIQKKTHKLREVARSMAESVQSTVQSDINSIENGVSRIKLEKSDVYVETAAIKLEKSEPSTSKSANPTKNLSLAQLQCVLDEESIYKRIATEAKNLETRNDERVFKEARILEILRHYLLDFDPSLNALPFGSTTYGFGGFSTNFNILVDTSKYLRFESDFRSQCHHCQFNEQETVNWPRRKYFIISKDTSKHPIWAIISTT